MVDVKSSNFNTKERYTLGYSPQMIEQLQKRTAAKEAGFLLPHLCPGMRLLDCGCGPGGISVGLAEAVAPGQVVGVDIEPSQLKPAQPLEATEDGLCVASGLDVPFCTHYGPSQESFILMKCRFRNQTGFYCSHVFHNGPAGIAAGREIYGTPKVYADLATKFALAAMDWCGYE